MTTYWEVETYSKRLIRKVVSDPGRDKEVTYASGSSKERCLLEIPDVSSEPAGAEDHITVDGDPGTWPSDPAPAGRSALSLSYDPAGHSQACLAKMRAERDPKLKASDWMYLSDTPTPDPAWTTYRQALRDLPDVANTPDPRTFDFDNDWPTEPS